MQLFIRDPSGRTTALTASSPLELHSQVIDTLNISPSSSSSLRLSHRSRTLPSSATANASSSFADLAISPYSTIDLSFRLRGGGPKKRCAHVFVKAASASNTPSTSGVATPSSSTAAAVTPVSAAPAANKEETSEGAEKKEDTAIKADELSGPVSVIPAAAEPVLERCSSAALRMVGECPKCSKNFCGQHRLPEDHACPALQTFRKAAFDENMKKLNKEATFTSKISAF